MPAGAREEGLQDSRPRGEVGPRFSRALSPGGSHVSSSRALPDGGRGRWAQADQSRVVCRAKRRQTPGRSGAPTGPSSGPPPRVAPAGSRGSKGPGDGSDPRLHPPSPGVRRKTVPDPGQEGGSGRNDLGSGLSPGSGQRAWALDLRGLGLPTPARPDTPYSPLARLRAFSGLWK